MATIVPCQPPVSGECRIAFVGEAPSDEECIDGLPLVGPSGRVFKQILRTAGLAKTDTDPPANFYPGNTERKRGLRPILWERSDYLVTNVFDQKLPENNVKNWCIPEPEFQKLPEDQKLSANMPYIEGAGRLHPDHYHHLHRLQGELLRYKPTVIVSLGGTALWSLLGRNDIVTSRGAVGKARFLVPGTKLLPTIHPAHVIKDWKLYHVVVADLTKAVHESKFPEIRTAAREIWIEPTLEDIRDFKARYLDSASIISVDIETSWQQITCIGFAADSKYALVVPFVDYRRPGNSYWADPAEELAAWKLVGDILDLPAEKLLQNGPYDTFYLWWTKRIKVRNYNHDTRLMHHALYPELPKSLQFMGATYANEQAWKQMREKKSDKRDE